MCEQVSKFCSEVNQLRFRAVALVLQCIARLIRVRLQIVIRIWALLWPACAQCQPYPFLALHDLVHGRLKLVRRPKINYT